jgi:hypothetical protein
MMTRTTTGLITVRHFSLKFYEILLLNPHSLSCYDYVYLITLIVVVY